MTTPWSLRKVEQERLKKQLDNDKRLAEQYSEQVLQGGSKETLDKLRAKMSRDARDYFDFDTFGKDAEKTKEQIAGYEEAFNAAKTSAKGFSGVLAGIGRTIGNMAIDALIGLAITAVWELGDSLINAEKNAIEAAEATTEAWKKTAENQKQTEKFVEDYGERYEELSKGVEQGTGVNLTLNAEEYKEWYGSIS